MNQSLLYLFFLLLVLVTACRPVVLEQQQATATAFARSELMLGRQSAESAALALCNVDFQAGSAAYQKSICGLSTRLGCQLLSDQIAQSWQDFTLAYPVPRLTCELRSSRLLEESRQFGLPVQYWLLKLHGEEGWTHENAEREYWLQVARENGHWKLNRILVADEVRYYTSLLSIETTGQ